MELSTDVKKAAFRVGYRLGIGAGTFYDWIQARDSSRPEAIKPGAWNQAFDKIADAAMSYAHKRFDSTIKELDELTEYEIEVRFGASRSSGATFTEYPREHFTDTRLEDFA